MRWRFVPREFEFLPMPIAVQLAPSLSSYACSAAELSIAAATLRKALNELARSHPAVYQSVCDETGAVRRHINLFVNSTLVPVREPQGLDAALRPGDVLTIWPAVSGG
jgi:molybdopterin converting factor small subunit